MCLIIVESRMDPASPLVVAANRDERFDRPAIAMTTLGPKEPRVLGGQDLVAGGTWLAVNEHGVVAGLTNRPSPGGRDPSKRSRGELPLALASHMTADEAVKDFVKEFRPTDFNLAWLLVGDRDSLYYLTMADTDEVEVEALGPGRHVLANGPLGEPSPKVDFVQKLLEQSGYPADAHPLVRFGSVLASHCTPPSIRANPPLDRPSELFAACVHSEGYGTRSSTVVAVRGDAKPNVWTADGAPCRAPFVLSDRLWSVSAGQDPAI